MFNILPLVAGVLLFVVAERLVNDKDPYTRVLTLGTVVIGLLCICEFTAKEVFREALSAVLAPAAGG